MQRNLYIDSLRCELIDYAYSRILSLVKKAKNIKQIKQRYLIVKNSETLFFVPLALDFLTMLKISI